MTHPVLRIAALVALAAGPVGLAAAQSATVYRCPGKTLGPDGQPITEYTNNISAARARELGCRTIEGAPITVISTTPHRDPAAGGAPAPAAPTPRPEGQRVPSVEQQRRDDERRTILQSELRSSEQKLADLRREYNNGEPERLGNERNYAKYQERVAALKASIERHESDIESIKREIAKLP